MVQASGRPTIIDVAAASGLSRSVVSRVLTGTGSASLEARDKVLVAAAKLGYRPNSAARTLVTGRSQTVGVLVRRVTDPAYSHLIVGLQDRATHYRYRTLTVTGNLDVGSERDGLQTLLSLQVDGLVIGSGSLSADAIIDVAQRAATVVCWRDVPGVDVVRVDERSSAEELLGHLAGLGHRIMGFLTVRNSLNAVAKSRAVRAAAARLGITLINVPASYDLKDAYQATQVLVRDHPEVTAVIGLSGWAGVGALTALTDAGLSVPGDVSVACYNAVELDDIPQLGLTNMRQSSETAAAFAMDMIMDRLADPAKRPSRHLISAELVLGKTAGPAR